MREFENEYRQTTFWVDDESVRIAIKVGEANAELDELLFERRANCWAFITAYNPASSVLSDEQNRVRQSELIADVKRSKHALLNGYGQGSNGDWPRELSIFVIDIEQEAAIALGRKHGQSAIVVGVRGELPELVWCD